MDIDLSTSARLINWARWERCIVDPRAQLDFIACPMFRELKSNYRGVDGHTAQKLTDNLHNPDEAEITEAQICMMADRRDIEYLVVYFIYGKSKGWIKDKTGESERGVGERLAGAIKSFEATYTLLDKLDKMKRVG